MFKQFIFKCRRLICSVVLKLSRTALHLALSSAKYLIYNMWSYFKKI